MCPRSQAALTDGFRGFMDFCIRQTNHLLANRRCRRCPKLLRCACAKRHDNRHRPSEFLTSVCRHCRGAGRAHPYRAVAARSGAVGKADRRSLPDQPGTGAARARRVGGAPPDSSIRRAGGGGGGVGWVGVAPTDSSIRRAGVSGRTVVGSGASDPHAVQGAQAVAGRPGRCGFANPGLVGAHLRRGRARRRLLPGLRPVPHRRSRTGRPLPGFTHGRARRAQSPARARPGAQKSKLALGGRPADRQGHPRTLRTTRRARARGLARRRAADAARNTAGAVRALLGQPAATVDCGHDRPHRIGPARIAAAGNDERPVGGKPAAYPTAAGGNGTLSARPGPADRPPHRRRTPHHLRTAAARRGGRRRRCADQPSAGRVAAQHHSPENRCRVHRAAAIGLVPGAPGRLLSFAGLLGRRNDLVDGAEDAGAVFALGLDADGVAVLHEAGAGLAVLQGLDAALFGNAAIALGPLGAAALLQAPVAHGAAADDGAGAHIARAGQMGDELAEVKGHLRAGLAHADLAAVPGRLQHQVRTAMVPGRAELVQRHGHRAESSGRLGLQETEALGQFGRHQVAQRHIVGNHHQADAFERLLGRDPHLHIAGDDREFGLEVDAHGLAGQHHGVAGADEVVAAALVHQGVGVETFRHLGVARLAQQLHMVDVSRAIRPLVGARQPGHGGGGMEWEGMARAAGIELLVQVLQLGRDKAPVVQHLLELVGNAGLIMGQAQVAGDNHQLAVTRTVFVGRKFHLRGPWIRIQSTPAHLSAMDDHAVAVHTLRPRRTLVLVTALVLALHWLVLSHWPLAWNRPVQPADRVLSVRSIAVAPPTATPAPTLATPTAPPAPQAQAQAQAPQAPQALPDAEAAPAAAPAAAPDGASEAGIGLAMANTAATPEAPATAAPDPPASAPLAAPAQDARADISPPDGGVDADGTDAPDATVDRSDTTPAPVQIPAPTRLAYEVSGQARQFTYSARAELLWQHDGSRYEARQEIRAFLLGTRAQSSVGRITPQGLRPERFSDRARSEQVAHFDHDRGRVSFSASTPEAAVDPGAQDRLSIFIQLGALLAADPGRFVPGTGITLTSVSARSADRWTFTVEGPETLDLPAGPTPTLKLQRRPRHGHDQRAELWLAPALGHLPARIRLTQANGDYADLRLRSSSAP